MGLPLNRRTLVCLVCGIVIVWFFGREWRWENTTIIPSCCFIFVFVFFSPGKDKRFGTIYAPLNGQIALSWVFGKPTARRFLWTRRPIAFEKEKVLLYTKSCSPVNRLCYRYNNSLDGSFIFDLMSALYRWITSCWGEGGISVFLLTQPPRRSFFCLFNELKLMVIEFIQLGREVANRYRKISFELDFPMSFNFLSGPRPIN